MRDVLEDVAQVIRLLSALGIQKVNLALKILFRKVFQKVRPATFKLGDQRGGFRHAEYRPQCQWIALFAKNALKPQAFGQQQMRPGRKHLVLQRQVREDFQHAAISPGIIGEGSAER